MKLDTTTLSRLTPRDREGVEVLLEGKQNPPPKPEPLRFLGVPVLVDPALRPSTVRLVGATDYAVWTDVKETEIP